MSDNEEKIPIKDTEKIEVVKSVIEEEKTPLKRTRSNDENNTDNKRVKSDNATKDETKEVEQIPNEEKAKFVFGSTTKFGSGFNVATEIKKDNSKDSKSSNDNNNKNDTDKPKVMAFGSGFSFGSGFGVLKTDNESETKNSEKDKKEETSSKDSEDNSQDDSKKDQVNTENDEKVQLHKQDVKSGEELEETLIQANAKLYQLVDMKTGWKERGTGVIKVNKDSKNDKYRIIMRTRTILKVILNLPLVKGVTLMKGFPGSLQSEKFIRIIGIGENNKPLTYALKTGNEETTEDLYKIINDSIPK
ncbi:similar to Saccharomyces cerevisiae YIL063C YRB2 Protein of unknown function involved in nuclear processes of the Ran-GTPase cycle [Maudiozyma barnettii]|uniref:RanBD1 domain-containing protein n=1 Tax=Maudiozyma barnettii TaxID=61262 RepID=A0A8H2ZFY7_9SACH|nr:Yrb2p [Kazachstania barnettii]CAB4252245.1 similar to Saccharomyces cerevisiae YIL063C YRB2 Protein of unknown function involved in nuclear processes of the Ran-GTPase cycle [Kazachstania barnettii]CAD1778909.1 similar to Saccharomyces cerevisiae YIL063C YRB2 Protein of unknown function involved in nuclear processes of the Ran-GTPase cycle [Kazachstania barnettii]